MLIELNNFLKLTNRRAKRQTKKSRKKLEKEKQRTWKAGKLITFVSLDIFGKEHRFLCQMKKCNKDFAYHRCVQCKIINHYRVCMSLGGEMCHKCMKKSDLACYPHKLRTIK